MICKKAHHHSVLAYHGGAARVKQLLAKELERLGWQISKSSEISDNSASNSNRAEHILAPSELAAVLEPGIVFHLHTTQDWALACSTLAWQSQMGFKPVITLHDISLLTGSFSAHSDHSGAAGEGCQTFPLEHDAASQSQNDRLNALRQLAPVLVSPSGWLAKQVKKTLPELGCQLIPNGVESNPISYLKARETMGIAPEARVVSFVAHGGVLASLKGSGHWKSIWAGIKTNIPNAIAFMVGGERESRAGDLIEWPYVEHGKLQILMAASDLMVYPSLADNHPLVVLEAMSASTAVCAYRVGGIPEQIREGETGFLVAPNNKDALIAACVKVLSTSGLARDLGKSGRVVYERHFQAEDMAKKYQNLYQQLLAVR